MARLYGPGPDEPESLQRVEDLAGLPVDDADGRSTGEVFGALAEAESGLLRYLDVALGAAPRHVLVPIGHIRIEEHVDGLRARLRAAMREDLAAIPAFEPDEDALDDELERSLLAAHGRLFYGERYYAHPAYDHSGLYAGEHPITREEEEAEGEAGELVALSDRPDYRVVEGEPDIRGWPLLGEGGSPAGWIEDLVIEPAAGKVRYALVAPAERPDERVLLPIGFLAIEPGPAKASVPALTAEDVAALPALGEAGITRAAEDRIRRAIEDRLAARGRRAGRPDFALPPGLPDR